MEFSKRKWRMLRLAGDQRNASYPHCLQFYLQPPSENISLIEFENLAIDRVKLLKSVENLGVSYVKGTEQYQSKLESELRRLKFSYRENLEDEYEPRRRDHISHFILRLAYCQSEELRRWFIQQEMDLLRFRFSILPKDKIQDFLKDSQLQFEAISDEEKTLRELEIIASSPNLSGSKLVLESIYKIPFADALDLFRGRKVYLEDGFAYVPLKDIVAIILNEFRAKLSKALALTARSLPAVQSDERLQPLLNHLSHSYTGQDYSTQGNVGKISLDQIDLLSIKSFPPCMRQLHKALRENHHLRHGGRMQYGLFLKGIGLTLEQALQFWKQEFIKGKMDPDKFDKGYSYNIRHSFGKEGKRTDYTPFSCLKIILSNPPSQGDYHGCPFRHSDPELLKQKLQSYKISPGGISQILDLAKGTHYQVACQKYFEMIHNVDDCGFSLNHPNQFFCESQRILNGGKDIKKEPIQPETPQPKPSIQKTKDVSSALASLNSSLEMDMEGLEDYFSEDS
ncbi:PREDICTED: DNA primase large subunit [Colobus angolensis palliatus]|uniref:DNA primase large subunit n=1 Tax=Colobus angolensis palliatus TaxID=336983 RepID=A0A2K5I886_COLAP|nr:PREDICTED: DNA primase large subunit [Colobus angolensis palliatus]XP_011801011.1 PREDICTED: DNA primase large subunit [Colobus angolensis palliatus]